MSTGNAPAVVVSYGGTSSVHRVAVNSDDDADHLHPPVAAAAKGQRGHSEFHLPLASLVAPEATSSATVSMSKNSPSGANAAQVRELLLQRARTKKERAERTFQESSRAILIVILFCIVFMVIEVVFGVLAHSLAILTDAAHLTTDISAYIMSLIALYASNRKATSRYSYGWYRAEVLGTLLSVFALWVLVGGVTVTAFQRIYHTYRCSVNQQTVYPELVGFGPAGGHGVHQAAHTHRAIRNATTLDPQQFISLGEDRANCAAVDPWIMIIVGVAGIIVNVVAAFVLTWSGASHEHGGGHGHSHGGGGDVEAHHSSDDSDDDDDSHHSHDAQDNKSVAVKAAFIHALGDCILSFGVIVAGVLIWYFNTATYGVASRANSIYNIFDPLSSLVLAAVTVFTTRGIISTLVDVLMESTPREVNYSKLHDDLKAIPVVAKVNDLHVWSLAPGRNALSAHLVSDNHEEAILAAEEICVLHGIDHTTIQVDSTTSARQTHLTCHHKREGDRNRLKHLYDKQQPPQPTAAATTSTAQAAGAEATTSKTSHSHHH